MHLSTHSLVNSVNALRNGKTGNMHLPKPTNPSSSLPNLSGGETKRREAVVCKKLFAALSTLGFSFPVKLLQDMHRHPLVGSLGCC